MLNVVALMDRFAAFKRTILLNKSLKIMGLVSSLYLNVNLRLEIFQFFA
jgi:hypothetical protein